MPVSSEQLRIPFSKEKFDSKWNLVRTLLVPFFEQNPQFKDFYTEWIEKALKIGEGIYSEFISFCSQNQDQTPKYSENETDKECHHIECKFDGGKAVPENEIDLYRSNHILAHIIRFIEFKKPGDLLSIIFRLSCDEKISLSERGKMIAELNKDREILFWSSEWQRAQGIKGGKKGGIANTVEQFRARQRVGKLYGRKGGLKRQTAKTKERLQETFLFTREGWPFVYRFNPPWPSFADIMDSLDDLFLEQKIVNRTSFYKVFERKRTRMYSWILLKENDLTLGYEDMQIIEMDYNPDK